LIEQLLANLLTWFARSKLGLPIIFAALVFLGIFIGKSAAVVRAPYDEIWLILGTILVGAGGMLLIVYSVLSLRRGKPY
jgi:hypothetical protein